jgi:crotonobetainyl-CoA:carnitine CoA-transferase CaiB-like acyl-CoA transferase
VAFDSSDQQLAGLRVVEIGESIAAAVAGMVLADFGADVTIVEAPAGSRLRDAPAWTMWSRGKATEPVDLTTDDGQARLRALVGDADVAIVALEPNTADRLSVDGPTLRALNPRLVHCEITGFGRGHPLSHVAGHDGVVTAAGGRAHEFGVLLEGERPAYPAVPVATHGATMLALQGVFSALLERERTGEGQEVSTSLLRALDVFDLSGWAPNGSRELRLGDSPMLFYPEARTKDGVWVQFSQNSPRLYRALLQALELEHLYGDERFRTAPAVPIPEDARALRTIVMRRVGERTWDEWREIFVRDPNISAEPFARPGDALTHPQLVATGDVRERDDAQLGRVRELGPLFSWSETPTTERTSARPRGALLQGVTVLELATWIATPMASALLSELGARVIKIEPLEGDPMRRAGAAGVKCVQGKESITLDLKTDEGRAIVQQLAAQADVFLHNYRPGVPERLGIDDATLRARNPGLVYVYAGSYGSTGPSALLPAFHVTVGAIIGGALAQHGRGPLPGADVELTDEELGWWSRHLMRCNESNPDFNAALSVAAAVTMALYARERTGAGQSIETRMMAANAYVLCTDFVDYEGRPPRASSDEEMYGTGARNRLYRAADGWVFLAAPGEDDARRLADVVRVDVSTSDDALADELETTFAKQSASDWERELTAAGLACARVHDGIHADAVFASPWGKELGFVQESAATGFGPYPRYGRVVRTERDAELGPPGPADHAGAQTRAILAELGYSPDDVASLFASGIVGEPDVGS